MWKSTHEVVTQEVTQEQIWSLWSDVNSWHVWDQDIEYARLSTPFAQGFRFELKPKGGPKVKIDIIECVPYKGFTDFTLFPLAQMYSIHSLQDTPEGLKITHTIQVTGPLYRVWRKLVAQSIADGMPTQTSRLIETAKKTVRKS